MVVYRMAHKTALKYICKNVVVVVILALISLVIYRLMCLIHKFYSNEPSVSETNNKDCESSEKECSYAKDFSCTNLDLNIWY